MTYIFHACFVQVFPQCKLSIKLSISTFSFFSAKKYLGHESEGWPFHDKSDITLEKMTLVLNLGNWQIISTFAMISF